MSRIIHNKSGYTIMEAIIYIAIVSILLVGVVSLNIIIKQSASKFSVLRRVNTDMMTFFDNVDFLVRNSDGFALDNSGVECLDFAGAQGPDTYYLSLYFATSSTQSILPVECRGMGTDTASTTAVKVYWSSTADRGIYMDCYRNFINGNSGNCATIQGNGNTRFSMTSAKRTIIYDGGLQFATSTAMGNTAIETTLTMGIPLAEAASYRATTTASSTSAFRIKVANNSQPSEPVCADGTRQTDEICDSNLTSDCTYSSGYYHGAYVEDNSTCSGKYACNNTCSACISAVTCEHTCGAGGVYSGGYCWYLGTLSGTCTAACLTHGGCVAENWNDLSCTIQEALTDCATCTELNSTAAPGFVSIGAPVNCQFRTETTSQSCGNRITGSVRLCACSS